LRCSSSRLLDGRSQTSSLPVRRPSVPTSSTKGKSARLPKIATIPTFRVGTDHTTVDTTLAHISIVTARALRFYDSFRNLNHCRAPRPQNPIRRGPPSGHGLPGHGVDSLFKLQGIARRPRDLPISHIRPGTNPSRDVHITLTPGSWPRIAGSSVRTQPRDETRECSSHHQGKRTRNVHQARGPTFHLPRFTSHLSSRSTRGFAHDHAARHEILKRLSPPREGRHDV
jgi:hypothetical protein